jgi:hypothetical protein
LRLLPAIVARDNDTSFSRLTSGELTIASA